MSPLRLARQHTPLPACHANRMVGKCSALDLNPSAQGNVGFTERWPLTVGQKPSLTSGCLAAGRLPSHKPLASTGNARASRTSEWRADAYSPSQLLATLDRKMA